VDSRKESTATRVASVIIGGCIIAIIVAVTYKIVQWIIGF